MGVIPILVKLLGIHSHNTALTEMCLIAFGNLAELGEYNLNTLSQANKKKLTKKNCHSDLHETRVPTCVVCQIRISGPNTYKKLF